MGDEESSEEWRSGLSQLLASVESVNRRGRELEWQKQRLRAALTQGRLDIVEKERAMALHQLWNRDYHSFYTTEPIYADMSEDEKEGSAPPAAVYLSPLDSRPWIQPSPIYVVRPTLLSQRLVGKPSKSRRSPQPVQGAFVRPFLIAQRLAGARNNGPTISIEDVHRIEEQKTKPPRRHTTKF